MKYDWEDKAVKQLLPKINELNNSLDGKFSIWGFAIENEETGEACFVKVHPASGDVLDIDLSQDVAADAENAHIAEIYSGREIFKQARQH
jgi:hypothetical protein